MKCIYCNSEENLTISDIIPFALTGSKVKKRFVCKQHNAFTNENYESKVIDDFAVFRNFLGLSERDGDPVHFYADLEMDGYTIENVNISNKSSIFGNKRIFKTTDNAGKTIRIGDRKSLQQIKGATEEKIQDIDVQNTYVNLKKINKQKLFTSAEMLHTVAKIAYEWYCYMNNIEEYEEETYKDIVSYILNPQSELLVVEIVTDMHFVESAGEQSRDGTHMLFTYIDTDGSIYVIFYFWNIVMYKIRIHRQNDIIINAYNPYELFLYHIDGSTEQKQLLLLESHIESTQSAEAIALYYKRINKMIFWKGERYLTREYFQNEINKLKKILPKYKNKKCSFVELLDYGEEDRFYVIYLLEILFNNKSKYAMEESLTQNLKKILEIDNSDNKTTIDEKTKNETLERYLIMHEKDEFSNMIENAICFFEQIAF